MLCANEVKTAINVHTVIFHHCLCLFVLRVSSGRLVTWCVKYDFGNDGRFLFGTQQIEIQQGHPYVPSSKLERSENKSCKQSWSHHVFAHVESPFTLIIRAHEVPIIALLGRRLYIVLCHYELYAPSPSDQSCIIN